MTMKLTIKDWKYLFEVQQYLNVYQNSGDSMGSELLSFLMKKLNELEK